MLLDSQMIRDRQPLCLCIWGAGGLQREGWLLIISEYGNSFSLAESGHLAVKPQEAGGAEVETGRGGSER